MGLYRSQMKEYARACLEQAQLLFAAHTADGTGCCSYCGRPAPCPDRTGADVLYSRYVHWLGPEPTVDGRQHLDPPLARPYVTNRGRLDHPGRDGHSSA